MADTVNLAPVLNAIRDLKYDVVEISNDLNHVDTRVGRVAEDLSLTRDELRVLAEAFTMFVEQAERTATVQRSETKIGNLKAELDRLYGHYAVVRRTSVGVLQAFDVGNVTNKVISHVSEELMIQSPRYWLAPALVGLAAWSKDDQAICEKSIREAYNRDQEKTSLFFALVLRRVQRNDDAVRWLRHYLQACDPRALTREFAVILEASAEGAFGAAATSLLSTQLREWNDKLRINQDIVDAQINEWIEELTANRQQLVVEDYAELATFSPDFDTVQDIIEATTALGVTHEKFQKISTDESQTSSLIVDLLDDLLEVLVTQFDDEELPLRRDVAHHEAIIETEGDLKRAKIISDQRIRALAERTDAVTIQTLSAIKPDDIGVSIKTQKVAIGAGQGDFRVAVQDYTRAYRYIVPTSVRIDLPSDHTNYASTYGFPGFESTTDEDEQLAMQRLRNAWVTTFTKFIQNATFKLSSVALPVIAVTVAVLILFAFGQAAGLIGLLGGGGGLAYWIYMKKSACDAAVAKAESIRESATMVSCQILTDVRAQFFDIMLEYEDLDADESKLLQLIDAWPTAAGQKETN